MTAFYGAAPGTSNGMVSATLSMSGHATEGKGHFKIVNINFSAESLSQIEYWGHAAHKSVHTFITRFTFPAAGGICFKGTCSPH